MGNNIYSNKGRYEKGFLVVCFCFLSHISFAESYGIFKEDWNAISVNHPETVYYYVKCSKAHPKKQEIKDAIENYKVKELKESKEKNLFLREGRRRLY